MTALDLIKAAMRIIGVTAQGNPLSSEDAANGLEALKLMLQRWSAGSLTVYQISQNSVTLTADKSQYTIGDGGDVDATRPTRIVGIFVRDDNGNDFLVRQIDDRQYRSISGKTSVSQRPSSFWYNPNYPLGEINLYPVPNVSGETMFVDSQQPLTEFASLTTDASFPPEYLPAIKWSLASELAPEYGKQITRDMAMMARASLEKIHTVNAASQLRSAQLDIPAGARSSYNIYTDA